MKIRIVDFLKAMGEICDQNIKNCNTCPMKIVIKYNDLIVAQGCARDLMGKYKTAGEHVKKKVIERLKEKDLGRSDCCIEHGVHGGICDCCEYWQEQVEKDLLYENAEQSDGGGK